MIGCSSLCVARGSWQIHRCSLVLKFFQGHETPDASLFLDNIMDRLGAFDCTVVGAQYLLIPVVSSLPSFQLDVGMARGQAETGSACMRRNEPRGEAGMEN